MNTELLARCRSFVDEQSCGEWDDKAINEDAAKLYEFVQREAASALRLAAQSPEPVAWRAVPGFEGYYEASSDGRIRSVSSGHELSTSSLAGSGYVKADLWKANARKQTYLHRVIAETFLEPPTDDRTEINHIDGNKRNNAASNLEWSSRSENVRHSMYSLGNNVKPVVATDPDTLQEERYRSIEEAGRLGYCAASIYKCLTGKRDRHAGKTWRFDSAPPQSASDGALRKALEQIRTVCIDNAGDTVRHDLALKFIGKIASRALAASEATKSDGGEERPASNPLSEVTHRPSDPHEPATVLTKGGEGPAYIGRPGDAHNLYEDSARDTRPAEVTVEVRAKIDWWLREISDCNERMWNGSREMYFGQIDKGVGAIRALLDTYKIGAK
ncbi:NUMOD4 motif-containing HNH endonuclease [Afipia carboxidovorans]|uniref:NUMOD4 motif-containing HNH endonuclease n=1 Tax=Afipia carboxidovorans TaxID=40137 RepID=UPI00308CE50E|nr:hypothetical protein CRBSH125_01680 [Afipia carboxidovorans]